MNRSTYPHDPRDPRLRSCKRCPDRYMPPAFCETHKGTCLTCCERLGLQCGIRAATTGLDLRSLGKAFPIDAAQVQRDIDSLYGPQEDRGD